ncbi:MAG TPA: ATP-binding protein [Vicinamibacterales bacterium]|nr:ATP-binding protein [Vicinamibacterales bacterium]
MAAAADPAHRVLIFAPIGRDATLTRDLLAQAGIASEICASAGGLCAAIEDGAAAVILTEEIFETDDVVRVTEALRAQPPWSDIPVVLFAGSEGRATSARALTALDELPNVTLLDRPVRVSVAISVVRAAIRARVRQLEVRDLLVALHASREQAETANRLKDEFLATLSHELRTPLNAILGWTAMLRNTEMDTARVRRALEVIDRNARAQAQLVEDVLDMARVITGKLRIDLQPVALTPIVDAVIEGLRPTVEAKNLRLSIERGTALPTIRGDADRLQQVFWNLLSNAVKFTPEGGAIAVRMDAIDSAVTVSITDTGIGLDPQFLPFVFDRFRQADQTVTRGHGGLGLGLSIVKHLVELHGGRVTVHSEGAGRGSTFSVTLPVPSVLPPSADAPPREAPFGIQLHRRRVLVVDDDLSTRELLHEIFGEADAEVTLAATAADALLAVQAQPLDIVIADIGLPGEDGLSLMRRIRALPPPAGEVPAIALSAYTRLEDRQAARAAGFTTFVAKPASPQDLLRTVARLLDGARGDTRP